MNSSWTLTTTGLCLGLLICQTGCNLNSPAAQLKGDADRKATAVKTVALVQADIPRSTLQPASIHAYYRTEIHAKATGYVSELFVDIGDYVEAGATLAVLDIPEMVQHKQVIQSRIRRLMAEERKAQAGVSLAASQVAASKARLAESKAQMKRADALFAAAEAEFVRTEDLVQRQSLQARLLDEARKKRDSEQANKEAVQSAIASAEADAAVASSQQQAAEADLDVARAETQIAKQELLELQVMLDYGTLRAPFAGMVTDRGVELGELVRASQHSDAGQPLFVLSQVDKLRVRVPVPETEAPLVNQGDEITLTFPSFADEAPLVATVTRRSGSLDPSTRTMLVEAEIENPDGKLLPGMFGQASIQLDAKLATHVLPARAIRFDESDKAYVYVVGQDETVSIAQIETGADSGNSIEVVSGLQPGQRVIGPHLKRFREGQQVAIMP